MHVLASLATAVDLRGLGLGSLFSVTLKARNIAKSCILVNFFSQRIFAVCPSKLSKSFLSHYCLFHTSLPFYSSFPALPFPPSPFRVEVIVLNDLSSVILDTGKSSIASDSYVVSDHYFVNPISGL